MLDELLSSPGLLPSGLVLIIIVSSVESLDVLIITIDPLLMLIESYTLLILARVHNIIMDS